MLQTSLFGRRLAASGVFVEVGDGHIPVQLQMFASRFKEASRLVASVLHFVARFTSCGSFRFRQWVLSLRVVRLPDLPCNSSLDSRSSRAFCWPPSTASDPACVAKYFKEGLCSISNTGPVGSYGDVASRCTCLGVSAAEVLVNIQVFSSAVCGSMSTHLPKKKFLLLRDSAVCRQRSLLQEVCGPQATYRIRKGKTVHPGAQFNTFHAE